MKRISLQKIGVFGLILVCTPASRASSQVATPSIDSLVARFIELGSSAQWQPFELYDGCPELDSRQRRGISLLMSANLSLDQTDQLASAWASPLRRCADPTLEQWYFDTMSRLIREGELGGLFRFRMVIEETTTPAVQSYLRSLMLDPTIPENARAWAGVYLVQQLQGSSVRAEWQLAFESEQVPWRVVRYATQRLLNEDAGWFVPELAQRIRNQPDITQSPRLQPIFHEVFRDGSPAQRETIARAIEDATTGAPEDRRDQMRAFADWLRRGKQDSR
jgi:hypothetical protein